MIRRTVELATYESYLNDEYAFSCDVADARALDIQERQSRLAKFPHSCLLLLAYPEMDFANRWSWQQFGPPDGECNDSSSKYRTCGAITPHAHEGRWRSQWLAKTDYDFGYNEWSFASKVDLKWVFRTNVTGDSGIVTSHSV